MAAAALTLAGCGPAESAGEPPAYTRGAADYARVPEAAEGPALRFVDVTREAGVDFVHETGAFGDKWMPETMGSGGGFLDYDGDGWPDLFLVNGADWPGHETRSRPATSRLYRNVGDGRFRDVSRETGIAGATAGLYGMGMAGADYDADGDVDLYVTAVGTNRLLRNEGGRFRDVSRETGATGNSPEPGAPPAWSTAAAWVDVDRDGWLDLFVCNYVRWTPETDLFTTLDGETKSYATPERYEGESCRLYRSLEGRRFEDVTEAAGVFNPEGKSLGVAVADFDDDGWPDLVVANDTQPNFLYRNDGDGTFTDIASRAGVAYDEFGRARAGMGIDVADVTDRGRLSIAIGNFSNEPVSLYTQIGDDLFQDLAGSARLTRPTLLPLTFGLLFVDLDLDGHEDLVIGNGHIEPEIRRISDELTFAQPPQLFWNGGRGQFVELTEVAGSDFAEPVVARAVASADWDRDGDPDLLITVNGGPPKLLRNDLPHDGRTWVRLRLEGRRPNPEAIGASVTVHAGARALRRTVRTGGSYLAQSETNPVLVGLGGAEVADSVLVRWPASGETTRAGPFEAGRTHRVVEGAGAR